MMGVPGSYDTSVSAHFEDKDQEGLRFVKRYSHITGISIRTCNVCLGAALPQPSELDGVVLAGSYNSVHDDAGWQKQMRACLPGIRRSNIPKFCWIR
jgi:hypothetical protein